MKIFERIIYIMFLAAICSCKKDEKNNYENSYIITGTVIDQLTKEPLPGASVLLAWAPYCENINSNLINIEIKEPAITGLDGTFKIIVLKTNYDAPFPGCKKIYAMKDGFGASNKITPPPEGGNISQKIELYRLAQLKLHVKNDTVNNSIDEAEIWLDRVMTPDTYPRYRYTCSGKAFNTTFTLSNLTGNIEYFIWVVKIGEPPFPMTTTLSNYSMTLTPDTINEFYVSF